MDPITIHTQLNTPARTTTTTTTTTTTHNYVDPLKCPLIRSRLHLATILEVVFRPHRMVRRVQE